MLRSLQVKTVALLTLLYSLQSLVSGQWDITMKIRYEENLDLTRTFQFSVKRFRSLYDCMCSEVQECTARYVIRDFVTLRVDTVVPSGVKKRVTAIPVYQCKDIERLSSLSCYQLNETSLLSQKCTHTYAFHLNNTECKERCVELVFLHEGETLLFHTDIPDLKSCDATSNCPVIMENPKTETTPKFSTTTKKEDDGNDNAGVIAGVIVAVLVIALVVIIGLVWWKRRKKQGKQLSSDQHLNGPASSGIVDPTSAEGPASNLNPRPLENSETSPREQGHPASSSDPQIEYSQLDTQDTNTYEHAYAALSTSPYYNSNNDITANTAKAPKSGTLNNTSTSAYSNMATSTPNSRQAYSNTSGPDPTGNSLSAYYSSPTSSTECPSQQRNSYISIIGEPDTEAVYSQADVPYSTVTGDYVNRKP